MQNPRVEYGLPRWADSFELRPTSRVPLARTPTPIESWPLAGVPGGMSLSIKRDDLTGIELSGNKVRKLEFLLADALHKGCDTLITCGGIQSNHCRATAIAAARLGVRSVLFLRTDDPEAGPGAAGNVLLDRLVGAEIRLITREQYGKRSSLMSLAAEESAAEGHPAYVIPEGGSNGRGSWGYIEAAREVLGQIKPGTVSDIVVALGSGGTAAGLAAGLRAADSGIRLHGINVCDSAGFFHGEINRIYQELGVDLRSEDSVTIHDGHVGRGYALSQPDELTFLRETAQATGVFLDPVYTGKAAMGMIHELTKHPDRFAGTRILFIHTGGIFGLFATPGLLPEA